ncbi:hypothetical protein [Sphingobacterium wenxiniae]|uniref:Uncharacterized protein n=1 Tax=Sphingobacterium wenxiniae TaxID=683125 RepID=A0A1I6TE53_9SPHI|nr:hypothetical protein [Sphingobacterium wenxiniae]SFS87455.1 hypothetical protein SAMN05660206_10691 [Sphingobacterium wenxiniae]
MNENNTYHEGTGGFNLPESCRVNPFTVPNDYFNDLSSNIHARIQLDKWKGSSNGGFSVPQGYFEDAESHLKTQAKLECLKNSPAFEVPEDYFSKLEEQIQAQVKLEPFREENDFAVPNGYFEQLQDRISSRIFEEQLKDMSPTSGFDVPPAYFDKLTREITTKVVAPRETPVRRLPIQQWIQYAAAACVAVVLGIGSYNAVVDQPDTAQSTLATISEDEIINYLSASHNSQDMLYIMECMEDHEGTGGICTHVKEEDIEDYLNYML